MKFIINHQSMFVYELDVTSLRNFMVIFYWQSKQVCTRSFTFLRVSGSNEVSFFELCVILSLSFQWPNSKMLRLYNVGRKNRTGICEL